jgi:hypothetical protein
VHAAADELGAWVIVRGNDDGLRPRYKSSVEASIATAVCWCSSFICILTRIIRSWSSCRGSSRRTVEKTAAVLPLLSFPGYAARVRRENLVQVIELLRFGIEGVSPSPAAPHPPTHPAARPRRVVIVIVVVMAMVIVVVAVPESSFLFLTRFFPLGAERLL